MGNGELIEKYKLSDQEREALTRCCASPAFDEDPANLGLMVQSALSVGRHAPELAQIRDRLAALHKDPNTANLLIVSNLPLAKDPRRLGAILGNLLGPVVKFKGEGDYLVEIREDPSRPGERPSFANAREFFPHTDLTYVADPPRFFGMHSVVNNPGEGGLSVFSDVRLVVDRLTQGALKELQKPQFLFVAPPHYEGVSEVRFPILKQTQGRWDIRFRRDNLRAESRSGIEGVIDLVQAIGETGVEVMLEAGMFAFINNRGLLHGRTAFASAAGSRQGRHLNRMYIATDGDVT